MSQKKVMRMSSWIIILIVLISTIIPLFTLSGCVMSSPLFSARDNRGTIVIEKPPVRVIYSGEYPEKIDVNGTIKLLNKLNDLKYKPYKFESSINIDSTHKGITTERYENKHKH